MEFLVILHAYGTCELSDMPKNISDIDEYVAYHYGNNVQYQVCTELRDGRCTCQLCTGDPND